MSSSFVGWLIVAVLVTMIFIMGSSRADKPVTPLDTLDLWARQCPHGMRWGEVTDQYGTKAIMFVCDATSGEVK